MLDVGQARMSEILLTRALPAFAAELEKSLRDQGRADLASQVCGDDFCATEVESGEGMIILDLVDDTI